MYEQLIDHTDQIRTNKKKITFRIFDFPCNSIRTFPCEVDLSKLSQTMRFSTGNETKITRFEMTDKLNNRTRIIDLPPVSFTVFSQQSLQIGTSQKVVIKHGKSKHLLKT